MAANLQAGWLWLPPADDVALKSLEGQRVGRPAQNTMDRKLSHLFSCETEAVFFQVVVCMLQMGNTILINTPLFIIQPPFTSLSVCEFDNEILLDGIKCKIELGFLE